MTQPFVPGYGPAIPAPSAGGGITVQDDQGNTVPAATTITFPDGLVAPGAPGEAIAKPGVEIQDEGVVLPGGFQKVNFVGAGVTATDAGGGVAQVSIPGGGGGITVQDTFGNVNPGTTLITLQPPASGFAGGPGEVLLTPFNAPTTPGQDRRATYADGGDLAYAPTLTFDGASFIPTFKGGAGLAPVYANVLGYSFIRFEPQDAPAGAPWFGSGNGWTLLAQHAAAGSGAAGGEAGVRGGHGRDGTGIGGHAWLRPGGNPDVGVSNFGESQLRTAGGSSMVRVGGANGDAIGFFGSTPETQPTVTGSRGGNAALADLLTMLQNLGLIIDATTP